ncbi:hypothetical protein A2Z53_00185 [Candidatus Giovannonibacteria bacterium RIFCSPHIGHO2_02_42_15]|uniref:Bacterial sugar transferase domain-containing protein n=2 Tax=Candidatus Giovannoniibacteriota TaxID=1752738 RepID=A0A1F5VPX3_9BACT|nr:MAG: sugar transferase [Candidatus Giovannonibacteria bacterium GW2011_GWF2_42_19]OGF65417.1 MAG: hypothetical protein A2Z53_00185 [Candidatus Giovannonibacteria bacterium RIFCSPHIGHO2_02_42_15]
MFRKQVLILIIGDVIIFVLALFLALVFRYLKLPTPEFFLQHLYPFSLLFFIWVVIFYIAGLYSREIILQKQRLSSFLLKAQAGAGIAAVLFFYFMPFFRITPRANLFLDLMITLTALWVWRILARYLLKTKPEEILLVASGPEVDEFKKELDFHPSYAYKIKTHLSLVEFEQAFAFSDEEKFFRFLSRENISLVVADFSAIKSSGAATMFYNSLARGMRLMDFKDFYEDIFGRVPISLLKEDWFFKNIAGARYGSYRAIKRIIDFGAALVLLLPALLLFPFIALGIILSKLPDIFNYKIARAREGDGIIFFRQARVGENGRIFNFIKFRSQVLGAEKMSHAKEGADERYYAFGNFMRKLYLDELAQIINVLKGEMSFVGPRPERPKYVEELKRKIPYYEIRLLVPPGITGWAQINMENDASVEDASEKILYDLYYIKNFSLMLDLRILLKTIATVLSRSGR